VNLRLSVVIAFCLLAILNSGGYRYGASDQAFYIPVVAASSDSTLFPRDRPLLDAEGHVIIFDEIIGFVARQTGWRLQSIFFVLFLVGLAAIGSGLTMLGETVFRSGWATAAFVLAMTLRHRIPRTGVNTLEGYLHPRMFSFAVGVFAVHAVLRERAWRAAALVAAAALLHPTTGVWFAVLSGVAFAVNVPRLRAPAGIVAAGASAVAIWMMAAGPFSARLVRMDEAWVGVLDTKDYLFPAMWPIADWIVNLAYPLIIIGLYRLRVRDGSALPAERGVVVGTLALVVLFLLVVPLTMVPVALAVQMQVPRVFWLLDLIATMYVVWVIAERGGASRRRPRLVALCVLAAAATRGAYIVAVEHPGRPVIQTDLPADEWTDVMARIRALPEQTHVLADPGHAWKYGTSVRVAAMRDVYLEEVKDTALALYSREIAQRVTDRIGNLPDFTRMTEVDAQALARRYELDVLVTDRPLALPEVYRNGRFRVLRLRDGAETR
jgi:hypothetical protein